MLHATSSNQIKSHFMQHRPTSCNRVFKRCNMLRATMLDDVACNMLRSFERGFKSELYFWDFDNWPLDSGWIWSEVQF